MNHNLKRKVLQTLYYEECQMVGEDHVETMINQSVELEQSEFGSESNLYEIFLIIASVAAFVDSVVSIYANVRGEIDRVKQNAIDKNILDTLSEEEQIEVIETVVEELKAKND